MPNREKIAKLAADFMLAFNKHDTQAILALMSPHPVWEFAIGPNPFGILHDGKDAVRKAIETTFEKNPDVSYKTLRTYTADDSVIYEVLTESPKNNLKVQSVDIMTFDNNDKVAFKRTYRKTITKP